MADARLRSPRFAPGNAPNGVFDNMLPVRNSYALAEHLPRAMLLTYPDAGHGSLTA